MSGLTINYEGACSFGRSDLAQYWVFMRRSREVGYYERCKQFKDKVGEFESRILGLPANVYDVSLLVSEVFELPVIANSREHVLDFVHADMNFTGSGGQRLSISLNLERIAEVMGGGLWNE